MKILKKTFGNLASLAIYFLLAQLFFVLTTEISSLNIDLILKHCSIAVGVIFISIVLNKVN